MFFHFCMSLVFSLHNEGCKLYSLAYGIYCEFRKLHPVKFLLCYLIFHGLIFHISTNSSIISSLNFLQGASGIVFEYVLLYKLNFNKKVPDDLVPFFNIFAYNGSSGPNGPYFLCFHVKYLNIRF